MRRATSLSLTLGLLIVAAALAAQRATAPPGGTAAPGETVEQGESCPPGTTLVRPGRCQAPLLPPPSIVDYRPRSTVVAEETPTPRARYPVVDIHSHQAATPENISRLISEMDALNLQVLVNLTAGSGERLNESMEVIRRSAYPDRFRVFTNVEWDGAGGPNWQERAVAGLEEAVANGAIGLKVAKNLGLHARKADGSRLRIDDPALDPVWAACARLDIPVLIHVADPAEFFEPIDYENERWLELALFPNRQYPQDRFPSFEELMAEGERVFERHPATRFIAAHFYWYGNDLGRAARLLDRLPNVSMEVGAVLYEFGRQPRASREFFIKYQDRVLFGKDAYQPTEYPYFFRVFETGDEYFDYYRHYHAFWKLYGMELPDEVLKKLYYRNALRIVPGLPQEGWPD